MVRSDVFMFALLVATGKARTGRGGVTLITPNGNVIGDLGPVLHTWRTDRTPTGALSSAWGAA